METETEKFFNILFFCDECSKRKEDTKITEETPCLIYYEGEYSWLKLKKILVGKLNNIYLIPHIFQEIKIKHNLYSESKSIIQYSRLCGICGLNIVFDEKTKQLTCYRDESKTVIEETSLKKWNQLYLKNEILINRH